MTPLTEDFTRATVVNYYVFSARIEDIARAMFRSRGNYQPDDWGYDGFYFKDGKLTVKFSFYRGQEDHDEFEIPLHYLWTENFIEQYQEYLRIQAIEYAIRKEELLANYKLEVEKQERKLYERLKEKFEK